MILGFALKKISLKNMLNRGKEQLQHILIKVPVTHWLFSLLDCQIVILWKIFSVVNFGLCNNSAMVEKKLFEQCWRACTPFWTLISIISKDGTFQCSTLKSLKKRDCLAYCWTSCVPCSECMEQSALCMSRTTAHTTDISPLRGHPAAGGICLYANLSGIRCCSGIWAVDDIIKDAKLLPHV